MKILLDTHVIIWVLTDDPRLSAQAREMISSPDNVVYFSTVSLWEIAIKNQKAPLKCPYHEADILNYCMASDMESLSLLPSHVLALRNLHVREGHFLSNQDPFDRMLVAQARAESLLLLTHDLNLTHYQEECILLI